jgi:hypothetical protein
MNYLSPWVFIYKIVITYVCIVFHSFNWYLVYAYYTLSTVLDIRNVVMNNNSQKSYFYGSYTLVGKLWNKYINK